jgi:hypothetical protein
MHPRPTNSKASLGVVLGALLAAAHVPLHRHFADAAEPKSAEPAQAVEVRGRVVCLAEEMHRLYEVELPTDHPHLYGFKTAEGKYFTLLRTKYSEALFVDEQVQKKELILKGRTFPDTQILEVSRMRSVKNGVVQDLFYYCTICAIEMICPGKCDCCQGPVELVERPLDERKKDL